LSEEKNNMVRRLLVVLGVFLAFGCMAQIASASLIVNGPSDTFWLQVWPNEASGQSEGPFLLTDQTTNTSILTFCVQQNNYFWSTGSQFTASGFTNEATTYNIVNGTLVAGVTRIMSPYAAWVYNQFENLNPPVGPSTNLNTVRPPDGFSSWGAVFNAYQEAIWAGMILPGGAVGDANSEYPVDPNNSTFQQLGINLSAFGGVAAPGAEIINFAPYIGGGYPMGQNQSVPIIVFPEGNASVTPIPEPTTIAIWGVGVGLAGAAALRRRRQPGGRWSDENRQAIFHIIEGKR
jgi:MYXO-CTERM domain-containing protein